VGDLEFAARVFQSLTDSVHTFTQEEVLSATTVLGRYVKQRPNDACALHLFGLLYERLGQLEQGAEEISRAIALLEAAYEDTEDPVLERQFTIAHANLARLKVGLCDYTGALESFETVLGLLPDQSVDDDSDAEVKILRVQTLFGCGLARFKLQDLQNAMSSFQAALDAVGENPVLRAHVTVLLAQSMWAIGTEEFRESAKALLLDRQALQLASSLSCSSFFLVLPQTPRAYWRSTRLLAWASLLRMITWLMLRYLKCSPSPSNGARNSILRETLSTYSCNITLLRYVSLPIQCQL